MKIQQLIDRKNASDEAALLKDVTREKRDVKRRLLRDATGQGPDAKRKKTALAVAILKGEAISQ